MKIIKNRGTGAGGANTNKNGKEYEKKTCIEKYLSEENGWEKCIISKNKSGYYFMKKYDLYILYYTSQGGLKEFFKHRSLNHKKIYRKPDGVFIKISNDENIRPILFVIEKKHQNRPGSVDVKLWAGPGFVEDYKLMFPEYDINYCFDLNNWWKGQFKHKKFINLQIILNKYNIPIFWGEDNDYCQKLSEWVKEEENSSVF